MFATPGISTGYWNARKMPSRARSSGASASRSLPVEADLPVRHLVAGPAGEHVRERALARAVRAHDGVHLAGAHDEVEPLQDRRRRRRVACRFSISSIGSSSAFPCAQPTVLRATRRAASAPRPRTPSAAPGTPPCRSRSRSSRPRPLPRGRAAGSRRAGRRRSSRSSPRARPAPSGSRPRGRGTCARRTGRRSAASRTASSCARRRRSGGSRTRPR